MSQSQSNPSQSSEKFPDLLTVHMAICSAKLHQNQIQQELLRLSLVERLERELSIRERREELHKIFHPDQSSDKTPETDT